ncbi:MAG: YihY/virulence factor BrkB family protein [Bacteroidales bacterium]|nr:YihY/virulence factor BrkB family protein [Bacteroidales bacterium]
MIDFSKKYEEAKTFVTKGIWKKDTTVLGKLKHKMYEVLKIIIIATKGFSENKCSVNASALTFFTLLSIVPVVALAFAIAKGFGLENLLTRVIQNGFGANSEIGDYLIQFSTSMLDNTKGGLIAGIGVVMLLYAVFKLLSNIEEAFNYLWDIKESRSIVKKVTDYVSIMIFAPILLLTAASATIFLRTHLQEVFSGYLTPFLNIIIGFVPFILMWITFTLLYLIMPNTKVKVKSALFAGIFTGTIFQIWQWIFVTFQVGVSSYGAVYGSFAALPLFLTWLQTSWMIVLVGCEIAYSIQIVSRYSMEHAVSDVSSRLEKRIAVLIMTKIVKNFAEGKKPKDAAQWADEIKISQRFFTYIAQKLVDVNLLAEIKTERNDLRIFIPSTDINTISINTVCEKLDCLGNDDDFIVSKSPELDIIDQECQKIYQITNKQLGEKMLKCL